MRLGFAERLCLVLPKRHPMTGTVSQGLRRLFYSGHTDRLARQMLPALPPHVLQRADPAVTADDGVRPVGMEQVGTVVAAHAAAVAAAAIILRIDERTSSLLILSR